MMDLEDFDVTGAIRTGSDQTAATGQPYDFNSVAASDLLRTYGAHLRFNGIDPSKPIGTYHIGLYVKSGLLDTYTEVTRTRRAPHKLSERLPQLGSLAGQLLEPAAEKH